MIYSFVSHVGKVRKNNEDYCDAQVITINNDKLGIFALADGMGGHNKGEVASEMAVREVMYSIKNQLMNHTNIDSDVIDDTLKHAYTSVNSAIYKRSKSDNLYKGMGTTLVVAVDYKKVLYVANVGDSRCYVSRKDIFKRITVDNSVVEELVMKNIITEEEAKTHPARNQITRAVGTDDNVIVDLYSVNLKKGDKILLTSDGLTGYVENDIIKEIISNNNVEVDIISNDLVNKANEISGKDNITVIVVEEE